MKNVYIQSRNNIMYVKLSDFFSVIGDEDVEVNYCHTCGKGSVFVIQEDNSDRWLFIVPHYTISVVKEQPIGENNR